MNNTVFSKFLTSDFQIVAQDVRLDDLYVAAAAFQGGWIWGVDPLVKKPAYPTNIRRVRSGDVDELHLQLQSNYDEYLKCVHITLRQNGGDVEAKADWAAWTDQDHEHMVGYDFTNDRVNSAPIATCIGGDGYGVSELLLVGRQELCVAIRSLCSGKYFCADDCGCSDARRILANRNEVAEWEQYMAIVNSDGTVSFKSKANGKYVSVEVNSGGRLNARADVIDAWEKFWIVPLPEAGQCALKSYANNKFVTADPYSGHVAALADVVDGWERFAIIQCGASEIVYGGACDTQSPVSTCDIANPAVNIATGVATVGGAAACAAGVVAATTAATASAGALATIGTVGTGIGAVIGGTLGSGIGIVAGPLGGCVGTIPCAIGGGALGGSIATSVASTCASALGIATAPAWAVPVAVCGGVVAVGAGVFGLGRCFRWW